MSEELKSPINMFYVQMKGKKIIKSGVVIGDIGNNFYFLSSQPKKYFIVNLEFLMNNCIFFKTLEDSHNFICEHSTIASLDINKTSVISKIIDFLHR
jgi:hypothetical protein